MCIGTNVQNMLMSDMKYMQTCDQRWLGYSNFLAFVELTRNDPSDQRWLGYSNFLLHCRNSDIETMSTIF